MASLGTDHALKHPPELDAVRTFPDGGMLIHGNNANVLMGPHAGILRVIPEAKMQDLSSLLPKVNLKRSSNWNNWLLAIKGQETCRSKFACGGRFSWPGICTRFSLFQLGVGSRSA